MATADSTTKKTTTQAKKTTKPRATKKTEQEIKSDSPKTEEIVVKTETKTENPVEAVSEVLPIEPDVKSDPMTAIPTPIEVPPIVNIPQTAAPAANNLVAQVAAQLPSPMPVRQHRHNQGQNRGHNNRRNNWRNKNIGPTPIHNADFGGLVDGRRIPDAGVPTEEITGILDMKPDGNGILRETYSGGDRDAYISGSQIRRFYLRPGDIVTGPARKPKDNEQFWGLLKVDKVNGHDPEIMKNRVKFAKLTPVYPDKKIKLETTPDIMTTRLLDLVAPVGHGQRGMIVSPPKAGKTTMIKDIATGIATNYPDIHLMAVLIGERPEEVTDIRRHIDHITGGKGEVAASNFDEQASEQVRVSELALEKAKRMVEVGQHVVIVLDSITRLARAYNLAMPTSGRTLSGGFDPAALYPPKKFFGAARNFEEFDTPDGKKNASLTILGTALIDTGSRMDDLIYEEFKGTGNMELQLDRHLAERRIFPAIDVMRSGTRREDLLFDNVEYQSVIMMRRMLDMLDQKEQTPVIVGRMKGTKSNKEFLANLKNG